MFTQTKQERKGEWQKAREKEQAQTKRNTQTIRNPPWIFRIPHTPCVPGGTQTGYSYRQLVSLHSKYSYCSAKLQINTLIESQGICKYLACINSAPELGNAPNGRERSPNGLGNGCICFHFISYLFQFFAHSFATCVSMWHILLHSALLSSGMQF